MKIRDGFVSNSSSSSFIVQVKLFVFDGEDDNIASKEQTQILLDYGFKYTSAMCAEHIEWSEDWDKSGDESSYCVGYSVVCNEIDVMNFLIDNRIPFKALCHYGHNSVIYDGNDKIKRLRNLGIEASMHGDYDCLSDINEKYTLKEWKKVYK